MTPRILERSLLAISKLARKHSGPVILGAIILFLLCLAYSWRSLEFQTSREDLISPNDILYDVYQRYIQEFPRTHDTVVVVEGSTAARRREFIDHFAQVLGSEPEHFYAVFPRVELPFLRSQALMFLPDSELAQLVDALKRAEPFLDSLSQQKKLEKILGELPTQNSSTRANTMEAMLPFLNGIFQELSRSVESRGRSAYQSPWGEVLFSEHSEELEQAFGNQTSSTSYHTLDRGRTHILPFRLVEAHSDIIARLRQLLVTASQSYPDLQLGLTGETLLEFDEMQSSGQDSHRSAVFSIILVSLLFAISFRQLTRPCMAIFCLALAVGWTLGFTTFAIGHLNLLTISFATILIGLGIDFGIHLLFRYEEEFQRCLDTDEALDSALLGTGSDIIIGALSTATAFWAVSFTDFKGVAELGVIAGFGVIFCLLATLVVLPALISRLDRKRRHKKKSMSAQPQTLGKIENHLLGYAPWVLGLTVLFALIATPSVLSIGYDYNLLRLQDPSLDSVQTELSLIKKGGNTILFSVAVVDDLNEAREKKKAFEALSAVSKVEVISDLFPEKTRAKRQLLRELDTLLRDLKLHSHESQSKIALDARQLKKLGRGFESLNELFDLEKSRLLRHPKPAIKQAALKFEKQKANSSVSLKC